MAHIRRLKRKDGTSVYEVRWRDSRGPERSLGRAVTCRFVRG
jgi:hypothetical protein